MDSDLREVLSLLVQLGAAANRILSRDTEEEAPTSPVMLVKAELAQPAPEPEPAPVAEPEVQESVVVPEDFSIGQARWFVDKAPPSRRWYTPHAREQLLARYTVTPAMAYRTLQHVIKSIHEDRAVRLWDSDQGAVWAVNIFGTVGFVVTDPEAHTIVTFLPREARNDPQIIKTPRVRAELAAFENEVMFQRQGHLMQKQR